MSSTGCRVCGLDSAWDGKPSAETGLPALFRDYLAAMATPGSVANTAGEVATEEKAAPIADNVTKSSTTLMPYTVAGLSVLPGLLSTVFFHGLAKPTTFVDGLASRARCPCQLVVCVACYNRSASSW